MSHNIKDISFTLHKNIFENRGFSYSDDILSEKENSICGFTLNIDEGKDIYASYNVIRNKIEYFTDKYDAIFFAKYGHKNDIQTNPITTNKKILEKKLFISFKKLFNL